MGFVLCADFSETLKNFGDVTEGQICCPLLDLDIKSQFLELDLDIFVSLNAQLAPANMRLAQQDGNRV
jgi:hypothetical protein